MRSVLVDSGPFIALFDGSDAHHDQAVRAVRSYRGRLVTNGAVLTEVCHLLGFAGGAPRLDFLRWVERSVEVDGPTVEDLPRARALLERYANLPAGFTDATLVRLAERRGITEIFTVDRDFEIYRTLSRKKLKNRFFDS